MSRVEFSVSVEVRDHNGDVEFSAVAGEVVDLPDASCDRWVKRNKASYTEKKVGKPQSEKTDDDDSGDFDVDALNAALDELDHKNDDHWTGKGLPDVKVVNDLLKESGQTVTRAKLTELVPACVRKTADSE